MTIRTKEFQAICKTILLAVDNKAANLELVTSENQLYLNVTNREYYVSIKFELEHPETFHAVVNAMLFLDLISGIDTETFELLIEENNVQVKAGKSKYKLALIYENDQLMNLPAITIENKTLEMPISNDILKSINEINGKELLKVKNIDVNALQKLYYITETGCFTFTTGVCLNQFELEKPIQILLNDRIVKLFKLFNNDVMFSLGQDAIGETSQTKISLISGNVYLAAIITNDELLLSKIKGPYTAAQTLINVNYPNKLVLSTSELSASINRLLLFAKNSTDKANMSSIITTVRVSNSEFCLSDDKGNTEVLLSENGSYSEKDYEMQINIMDLKLILDSCKEDHITLNCGNGKSVVVNRININNLIPEIR